MTTPSPAVPAAAGAAGPPGYASRVRGCLLGGAVGDALGAPVEFWSLDQILAATDGQGVRHYLPARFGDAAGPGLVTDDTQMTLFTAEGIIRALVRADRGLGFTVGVVDHAYRRWLATQETTGPPGRDADGWLSSQRWLYSRRAPGTTCLGALRAADPARFGGPARNSSKGCGGVMRAAPFGLVLAPRAPRTWLFDLAAQAAGLTHGHPTGQVAAGALALAVAHLVDGLGLADAVGAVRRHLGTVPGAGETADALDAAVALAARGGVTARDLEGLGGGWVAEEALAIAVCAALARPGPDEVLDALALAVTHSGDSDSTGAICGNLLGALHGQEQLPAELVFCVEGRGTVLELADDLVLENLSGHRLHGDYLQPPEPRWTDRYPGW